MPATRCPVRRRCPGRGGPERAPGQAFGPPSRPRPARGSRARPLANSSSIEAEMTCLRPELGYGGTRVISHPRGARVPSKAIQLAAPPNSSSIEAELTRVRPNSSSIEDRPARPRPNSNSIEAEMTRPPSNSSPDVCWNRQSLKKCRFEATPRPVRASSYKIRLWMPRHRPPTQGARISTVAPDRQSLSKPALHKRHWPQTPANPLWHGARFKPEPRLSALNLERGLSEPERRFAHEDPRDH